MPTLYCPECGYNLTGLSENRCPECGEVFDPAELVEKLAGCRSIRVLMLTVLLLPVGIATVGIVLFLASSMFNEVALNPLSLEVLLIPVIASLVHGLETSLKLDVTRQTRLGRRNTPLYIGMIWPCWLLFSAVEFGLIITIWVGAAVVISEWPGVF